MLPIMYFYKMKNFHELGVKPEFTKGLFELGIFNPTEIQNQVIPLLLQSEIDLVGQAQTGTGKTVAFGLPLLQKIDSKKDCIQAIILCPTRELVQQVAKQLFRFTKYSDKIFVEAVYGGEKIDTHISNLRRTTHIIVATPGRLIDLKKRNAVDLINVKRIVLDEADEMLSMGFRKELDEILGSLPDLESSWLFSATISNEVREIINKNMSTNLHQVTTSTNNIVNAKIVHKFIVCDDVEKFNIILQFLNSVKGQRGIIFCRTKRETQILAAKLIDKHFSVDAIHGDLLQKQRDKVMRAFKKERLSTIISTDIAARGINIISLNYVVHYQLPDQDEYYTHRSGRTARAGKQGFSLVLANSHDLRKVRRYEKKLRISFSEVRAVK